MDNKLLSERLRYKEVSDPDDKGPYILIATLFGFTLLCILHFTIFGGIVLVLGLLLSGGYYFLKPRYCKTCSQKMLRFRDGDDLYFCCDKDRTKFRSILGLGDNNY